MIFRHNCLDDNVNDVVCLIEKYDYAYIVHVYWD